MTKKEYIRNSMFYTGEKNISLSLEGLADTLSSVADKTLEFRKVLFVEPAAGNGSFTERIHKSSDDYRVISYDTHPKFEECIKEDFLNVSQIKDNSKKIFIGFPPVREYEKFVKHSFELGAAVVAFIMPISSTNKKNLKMYRDNDYRVVFSKPVISNDFTLPNGDDWDFNGNFVILVKNEYIKKNIVQKELKKSYKDFFDVYTINTNRLAIRETSQPNLFRNGRVPKNRKTGQPYEILTDDEGKKYYYQHGINMDKIDECQLFLPLRVFPSKQEGMILYNTFDDKTFANIGFGLKVKDGYSVRKVKGKIIYYLYKERFRGIYTLVAKLDEDAVKNFYARKRYNNGVYVSSKKLIGTNKQGIL
jgi:hypothetical protein